MSICSFQPVWLSTVGFLLRDEELRGRATIGSWTSLKNGEIRKGRVREKGTKNGAIY